MGGSSRSLDADLKLQFPYADPPIFWICYAGGKKKDLRFVAERCV